ncbi:transcription termination/antitermination protein NusA [Corynebacterium sp. 320]|uniref:Transcription termination/antitermination protein NusA n=1 Tax=Corynebacterium zhongnanshanii TaxID=2768834 RepID=A0ABQ6VGN6_9CORY|nr:MULTISPECIES: transcription termination factor NusA [Corynebacterium]KAB1503789.1 transcription termination/antitermination protein NusA [Corynebacterium sp. 320]KAB1553111.1 transcription termination/antitermination protein NusA [Corynebacterium sp. 321]KAB1553671.1 transcription termination/antitermination protein NusA [Corynebacterium sp. 319]KAB3523359.1 transcription termination/antitermination protein NusA [Corynebacterium zhongnanshanii]KAB3527925.1 transcription termination/antiterm
MNIDMAALKALEKQENVPLDELLAGIKRGLLEAYRGISHYDGPARVDIDEISGTVTVYQIEKNEDGEVIGNIDDTPTDFGRAGALAVREAIRFRINSSRVQAKYDEYSDLRYTVVNGIVTADARANERGVVVVHLGTEANGMDGQILPAELIPGEKLEHGMRVRAFVTDVINNGNRSVQINLSRTHPELVRGLFALEVPEVADGSVEIVSVAREAGHRTKIAVKSTIKGLNAKGACIGPRGQRVANIMAQLGGEKIDIVDYSDDPAVFVGNALAPSKVVSVIVTDAELQVAKATVPEYQLSLAIGREGQNARLAARLTGWKIDIHPDTA